MKEDNSISNEENMTISGNQRALLMQKLARGQAEVINFFNYYYFFSNGRNDSYKYILRLNTFLLISLFELFEVGC